MEPLPPCLFLPLLATSTTTHPDVWATTPRKQLLPFPHSAYPAGPKVLWTPEDLEASPLHSALLLSAFQCFLLYRIKFQGPWKPSPYCTPATRTSSVFLKQTKNFPTSLSFAQALSSAWRWFPNIFLSLRSRFMVHMSPAGGVHPCP